MPLFGRSPKPVPPPSQPLPDDEVVERAVRATLLYGKRAIKGILHMTARRLIFEAQKGESRWLLVPFDEIVSAGLYRWPGAPMGIPSSRSQCLVVKTAAGEQVWWDFGERDEQEWLPLVQARIKPPTGEED
jgi:hypothetical protein